MQHLFRIANLEQLLVASIVLIWLATPNLAAASGTATNIFNFTAAAGLNPHDGLIQGSDGNFYGLAANGGGYGHGALYRMDQNGNITVLHSFNPANSFNPTYIEGAQPMGTLIEQPAGILRGTTYSGGKYGQGTIFVYHLATGEFGTPVAFSGADGAQPAAGLVFASDGYFYGTTTIGGAGGQGTIFRYSGGSLQTVHSFSGADGANPYGRLIEASDGNLYGTTYSGGASGGGTVFKLTTTGNLTTLHSFAGADGYQPIGSLIRASDDNFYGVTQSGGLHNLGAVFQITPQGVLTTFRSFGAASPFLDGSYPLAGLIQATDGNLYGTTSAGGYDNTNGAPINQGTVFSIDFSGFSYFIQHSFTGPATQQGEPSDGSYPVAGLIQSIDGSLYGTASYGGSANTGMIYQMTQFYPAPVVSSISPTAVDAGGPSFTLTVKGSKFDPSFSQIYWNGSPLITSSATSTVMKATVPAALIASPGTALVTVVTPLGGTSNAKKFTVLVTTLKLTGVSAVKNSDGSYTATVSLKNLGFLTAANTKIMQASLGPAATSTALPVNLGDIAAGTTGSVALTFPAAAGASGTLATLTVSGTFTGGKFTGSFKLTLP